MTKTLTTNLREAGSFKDPDGYIYYAGDSVYRHINTDRQSFFSNLLDRPIIQKLISESKLIDTQVAESEEGLSFKHPKLDLISYPYEWSLSQFIDAAIFTLDIQSELLEADLCLKDATPYNVQFINGKPIFIDFTSIEANNGRNIWLAYNQFLECFFYTIILKLERGISTKEILLANLDGIKVDQVAKILGKWTSFTSYLLEVGLPNLARNQDQMAKRIASNNDQASNTEANIKSQKLSLSLLRNKLLSLRKRHHKNLNKHDSTWSDYTDDIHYGSEDYQTKQNIIREIIQDTKPKKLIDLGANRGDFSMIGIDYGAKVISIDLDHDCIDMLYHKSTADNLDITPLWLDLSNPSPDLGWSNQERQSILNRLRSEPKADMVMALALMHHLLISSRIPLDEIIKFMASLTNKYLIIEYVGPDDPMFIKTLSTRTNLYQDINESYFESLLQVQFRIVRSYTEANNRKIYLLELNA